ncbi:MAG: hypothetical protein ACK452_01570 [Bacteroidota bacterium]
MSQEAKNKIAENLNLNKQKLEGISIQVELKINSQSHDKNDIYFMEKTSKMLAQKFSFYDISYSNDSGVATFNLKTDKSYSFPELKKFVTDLGYSLIDAKDYYFVKK